MADTECELGECSAPATARTRAGGNFCLPCLQQIFAEQDAKASRDQGKSLEQVTREMESEMAELRYRLYSLELSVRGSISGTISEAGNRSAIQSTASGASWTTDTSRASRASGASGGTKKSGRRRSKARGNDNK